MDWSLFVAACLFIGGLVWTYLTGVTRLPPGPLGFPLVGYLPMMIKKRPHLVFTELGKKYGKVFSLFMGSRLVVVLGTQEAIKEAFVRQADNFSGRPHFHFANQTKSGAEGIIRGEGEIWRTYRRFSLSTLKSLGVGTDSLEHRIKEEIGYFLSSLGKYEGKAFDIAELLNASVGNVIWSMLFGQRADYHDPDFCQVMGLLEEFTARLSMHELHEYLPILMKIPGISKMAGFKSAKEIGMKMDGFIKKKVMEHKSPYTQVIKSDFVDAWLTEAVDTDEPETFTDENLVQVLRSLLVAGTDTTANTLRWALLFMVAYPHVQKKVQKELDEVVPYLHSLNYVDRNKLHYTIATLLEAQRMVPLLPLSVSHSNFKETHLFGHLIPKRSIIIPNIYAVHHNPEIFPCPEQFRPERFLDDTTRKKKKEHLIPFSLGKRACLGESVAKMELLLYFASMMRCFNFSVPEGSVVSFDSLESSMSVAKPFKLVLTARYGKEMRNSS